MWKFIKSSSDKSNWLEHDQPEICFVGRSNVGKSSLINALANQKKLAKTSNYPGRTQLINYFDSGNSLILVDLPGYGYAKFSKETHLRISEMIDEYLNHSSQLMKIFILIDSRHGILKHDLIFLAKLQKMKLPFAFIATKIDKSNQKQIIFLKNNLKKYDVPTFLVSTKTFKGIEDLKKYVFTSLHLQ